MGSEKARRWVPTEKLVYGTIIKHFTPLQKHPELIYRSDEFHDIFIGAEIYIFEVTTDGKWCRSYFCARPLPEEFIATMSTIGELLPSIKPIVAVVPRAYVRIDASASIRPMPFFKLPEPKDFQRFLSNECTSKSLYDHLTSDSSNTDDNAITMRNDKQAKPSFPYFRYKGRPFVDEIAAVLMTLCSHIFAMYSAGEFIIYEKLTSLFYELDNIRLKLLFGLTTESERILLIRSASCELSKISKFISSKGKPNKFLLNNTAPIAPDPYGFESVFARDVNTGKLLSFDDTNLQTLLLSTMLYGLTNNFPIVRIESLNLDLPKGKVFDFSQSHVLIDFKQVTSDPSIFDPKFENVRASVHLRTKDKLLAEPYIVNINPNNISSLNNISAVLFKNIAASVINDQKIYLVVVLTEYVLINSHNKISISSFRSPFIPYANTNDLRIDTIKKGVAVGVTDISPIFKSYQGKSAAGSAHKFKINLYTSQFDQSNEQSAGSTTNIGWGNVISKILNDSVEGVIINPRAVSLSVTAKEIVGDHQMANHLTSSSIAAIETVPSHLHYSKRDQTIEQVYLNLGSVSLSGVAKRAKNIKNVTIVAKSKNPNVTFSENSNESKLHSWTFVSGRPGESIGETVRINDIQMMKDNEDIDILAYLNGFLMAKAAVPIKRGNDIIIYERNTTISLISSENKQIIDLKIDTDYPGDMFNIPTAIERFLPFDDIDSGNFDNFCPVILEELNNIEFDSRSRHFHALLRGYLNLLFYFNDQSDLSLKIFTSFTKFIDATLSSDKTNCRHQFFTFYEQYSKDISALPPIGPAILKHFSRVLKEESQDEWSDMGRSLCNASLYVVMLSVISSSDDEDDYKLAFEQFFDAICKFLTLSSSKLVRGQVSILSFYDLWLPSLSYYYEPESILVFTSKLFESCQQKEICLSITTKILSAQEENYLNVKFLLLRRVLSSEVSKNTLFDNSNYNALHLEFISRCIEWTVQPYLLQNDRILQVPTMRLANSVLITLIENIKDRKVLINMMRLIPTYCRFLLLVRKYYKKSNLFKTSRTFTKLFPVELPFPKLPMDSIVNDEIVVEILLEIATIICELTKVGYKFFGHNSSLTEIARQCENDEMFQSVFYSKEVGKEHILTITRTIKILLKGEFFPEKKWLAITALFTRCSLTLLGMCKDFMITKNSPSKSKHDQDDECTVDMKLWAEYYKAILMLSTHKVSTLTKLAIIPRKAIYCITHDLKRQAAFLLNESWDALGYENDKDDHMVMATKYGIDHVSEYQRLLLIENPSIMRELFVFAFSRHIDATAVSCKIIWSVAINFWQSESSFQSALNICIPELYNGFQMGKLFIDNYELERFIACIFYTVHMPSDDILYQAFSDFLKELLGFLHIVAESYKISGQEEFDDDRTTRHIEMFRYLLDANRPELFHKMINDLYIHAIKKKDYVQAGLGLELLASVYEWDPNDVLPAIPYPSLPKQSSFERKEFLYKEAARNFSKGLKLEKALAVYKDLIKAYDEIDYDLNGLAFVHDQISTIYTELQSIDRLLPTYFKVSFMGFGFPISIRNKMFIFEGLPFEHITSMQNRLLKIYHGSSIIQQQAQVDELLMKPPMGKLINVTTVEPQLDISDKYSSALNNKTRMYIENRNLRTFCNSRRLANSTSVTNLWVEEFTYTTLSTFPTLMYRSEIIEVKKRKLSPLENAIRSLQIKIQELNGLENMALKVLKEQGDVTDIFNELSRNITGTISAPINGGISQYKEFLKPPTCDQFDAQELHRLILLFDELTIVLSRCLLIHMEILPSSEYKESHNVLLRLYEENFSDEIKHNNINIHNTTLENLTKSFTRQGSVHGSQRIKSLGSSHWDRSTTKHMKTASVNSEIVDMNMGEILTKYITRSSSHSSLTTGSSHLAPSVSSISNQTTQTLGSTSLQQTVNEISHSHNLHL
ncbi:hypothetical protein KAFR_0A05680 [Kazachstania africana CBS 2517]|uniref:DOCKER domain-containing protein n=1 Tax=Kazachstania africana (strain ATCC 22294 / BCRC 22015 / CBS 2517 / CECT 1963 / NBRC 1671 / NRRL Y-8276) TaxID=1071382 RepID=H2ANQ3_KAZAF|nr:hypothetical protein KAFR_0A05680 [Kazachstania africana CBS 2517]CCF56003.1 hypothetical protein KAFR_0A05680 [Kazachstania africana CBS 2517]